MTRADSITLAQARAIIAAHEEAPARGRGRYVHTWEKLPTRVIIVTPGRGREAFRLVRPLLERLRELAQGECQLLQVSIDGRAWTPESVAALEWYMRNLTMTGLGRVATFGKILTKQYWLKLFELIEPEYRR